MGRRFPVPDDHHRHHQLLVVHSTPLSIPLFLASMSAVIAITSSLCGIRRRKKPKPKSENSPFDLSSPDFNPNASESPPPQPTAASITSSNTPEQTTKPVSQIGTDQERERETVEFKELPLPPAKQIRERNFHSSFDNDGVMRKSASTRSLSFSTTMSRNLSMKLPRSMSMARNNQDDKKKSAASALKNKLKKKDEDSSVWMKTIILGEKCKVPDEEEAVIYDRKGRRISAYHPKMPSSLPVSRQNSQIDVNAIPS